MKGYLALEDGRVFEGESFGAPGKSAGEIVFNTSMTGYQEILTDPSYNGQIITMTYPLIGNYGINSSDVESGMQACKGFVVREYCPYPSSWRSEKSLGDYLKERGIVALSEVDTRAVTKHIRTAGAMRAIIAAGDEFKPEDLVEEAKNSPGLVGRDLVSEVTSAECYKWTESCAWGTVADRLFLQKSEKIQKPGGKPFKVVAFDFGMKFNIPRYLVSYGCDVTIVPSSTTADEVKAMDPDGIFLSNGPGDPAALTPVIEELAKLVGYKPMFGICLGHQLLGLAIGAKTYKMKFGHRGANQPVKDLKTGRIEITSQNHGFSIDPETLKGTGAEVSHINLNDGTVEGLVHEEKKFFCVQYHPEASAGPHDAEYLFKRFMEMMKENA